MKKTLLYFAAVTALFAACTKEIEETIKPVDEGESSQTEVHSYKLVASIPTKTTLTDDIFNWASGETIAVADETTTLKEFAISEDEEERAAGIFTYDGALTGSLRYAVTPADNVTIPSTSGNEVQIELPTNYSYVAGQTNAVMISTAPVLESGTYTAHFAHTMALIKVSYTNVPVGTKYFKLTMDKYISGVTLTKDASTAVAISTDDVDEASIGTKKKYVTVTLASAVSAANTSITFYVPVPTGTYESFKVQLCDADDHILSEKNRDLAAAGKSLTLAKADVFATPAITLPVQKVLTFGFTTAVADWPTSSSNSAAGSYTYTLDKVDYTFTHTKTGNGIYQNSPNGQTPYLFMTNGNYLGLPTVTNYRLARVVFHNTTGGSSSAEIGITSRASGNVYMDDSAASQVMSTANTDYTFNLSDSYKDKRYYIVAAGSKNAQAYSITLTFEESDRTFTPSALVMSDITCTAKTSSTLTFSWDAVTGATGYKVSTDGGSSYGSLQAGTTYLWTSLSSFTDKTIYVKAIGDGEEYYDSAAKTAVSKTTLTVPTSISWTEGTKTVSWTDANSSAGTYNTNYKYVYTLDNGVNSDDASSATTAVLSIDASKTVKVKAVCLTDASLNSGWSDGVACTIGGGDPEYEWVKVTSTASLTDGEYIIINGSYYLPSTTTTSSPTTGTAPTITDGKIDDSDVTDEMKWTFSGTSSAMDITNSEDKYLCINGKSNTSLRVTDRTNEYSWVIAINGSGFSMKYYDTASPAVYRYCGAYGDKSDWRTYNSATALNYEDGGQVYFYKKTVK